MKLVLEFDCDADIIDVPQVVIDNRYNLQKKFTKWIYNKHNKHTYWIKGRDSQGNIFYGVRFRGDAFVEWLNRKILTEQNAKASVVAEKVSEYSEKFPKLLF